MNHLVLHLRDYYEFLGADGCDPTVELYLSHHAVSPGEKKPCLVVCPGGGGLPCGAPPCHPTGYR